MKLYRMIYRLGMLRSKKKLTARYGADFRRRFQRDSEDLLEKVIAGTPDIGKSIFAFNYAFTPAYIAWYRAMEGQGKTALEIQSVIWLINEQIMKTLPYFLMPLVKSVYLKGFRKKAPRHQQRGERGLLHPYDYSIRYRPIDKNSFQIDILSCGMRRLGADFDAEGLFPMVCRMDYLFASYMRHGFTRTKTLGDGDDCCNCRYALGGGCEWKPEKGFTERK